MRSFHMAPDRGMTIIWFNSQKNLDAAFPGLKEFQKALASRFEARCDAQKGITSKEFDFEINALGIQLTGLHSLARDCAMQLLCSAA